MAERQLDTTPADAISRMNDRIKRLEQDAVSRVLPESYTWEINGSGDLIVRNIQTGTPTTVASP